MAKSNKKALVQAVAIVTTESISKETPDQEYIIDTGKDGSYVGQLTTSSILTAKEVTEIASSLISEAIKNTDEAIRNERLMRNTQIKGLCDTTLSIIEMTTRLLKAQEDATFKRFCKHPNHSGFSINMLEKMWINRNTQLSW